MVTAALSLVHDTPHSLTDGTRRCPVVEGIPYLRTHREQLCATALHLLDSGNEQAALVLLLQDQDDWASGGAPCESAVTRMLQNKPSLREAMRALNFGPVADYFAYRWSDPTFLSGLALLQSHLPRGGTVLELACGIGHYLREFERLGIEAIGADVVFAKLWLARRYVAPSTPLLCFDAGSPFPFPDSFAQSVFCHDAFYFLPQKPHVASEMRRVAGQRGAVLIGHTHNAAAPNFSSGEPLSEDEYLALFPRSIVYDDAELTQSWIERRAPRPGASAHAAALALASPTSSSQTDFDTPLTDPALKLNPLFQPGDCAPRWPSERYRDEYAPLSGYLTLNEPPVLPTQDLVRRRVFLSLPERW